MADDIDLPPDVDDAWGPMQGDEMQRLVDLTEDMDMQVHVDLPSDVDTEEEGDSGIDLPFGC